MATVDTVRNQNLIESTFTNTSQRKTGEMGKDEFLNLLVTQLKYQDPLKPVDDKEFISQMAQFSSLEQMKNMNDTFSEMKAFTLVGKYINATLSADTNGTQRKVEGEVKSIRMASGKAYAVLKDEEVPVENITEIREKDQTQQKVNLTDLAGLIGRQATSILQNTDGKEGGIAGIIRSISTKSNSNFAHLDGSILDVVGVPGGSATTPEQIKNYLDGQEQKYVKLTVLDPVSNISFEVEGLLRSKPTLNNGKVEAILDDIQVPVDSITELTLVVPTTTSGGTAG